MVNVDDGEAARNVYECPVSGCQSLISLFSEVEESSYSLPASILSPKFFYLR